MRRFIWWTLVGLVLAASVPATLKLFDVWTWNESVDYSQEPAQEVFRSVFDRPLPNSVSGIRIAGRSYLLQHWCWMRFHADERTIKSLLKNAQPVPASEVFNFDPSARDDFNTQDKTTVGWGDWSTLNAPEAYKWNTLSAHRASGWWQGYFVVDRKNNLVFVVAHME